MKLVSFFSHNLNSSSIYSKTLMSLNRPCKHSIAFFYPPVLTFYKIQFDETYQLKQNPFQLPKQLNSLSIFNELQVPRDTRSQALWTLQEIDEMMLNDSVKSSSSSGSIEDYVSRRKEMKQYGQEEIKVYKPTWDTWEEDVEGKVMDEQENQFETSKQKIEWQEEQW